MRFPSVAAIACFAVLSLLSSHAQAASKVCGLDLRSHESRQSVTLHLVNDTAQTVTVAWINFQGAPVTYATLQRGSTTNQQTFITHAWIFTNAQGQCLGYLVASSDQTVGLGTLFADFQSRSTRQGSGVRASSLSDEVIAVWRDHFATRDALCDNSVAIKDGSLIVTRDCMQSSTREDQFVVVDSISLSDVDTLALDQYPEAFTEASSKNVRGFHDARGGMIEGFDYSIKIWARRDKPVVQTETRPGEGPKSERLSTGRWPPAAINFFSFYGYEPTQMWHETFQKLCARIGQGVSLPIPDAYENQLSHDRRDTPLLTCRNS